MRVAWLHDAGNVDGSKGGAELTMDEFRAAAPEDAEFVALDEHPDVAVVGNCTTIGWSVIDYLAETRVIRYWHDLGRGEHPKLREWVIRNATHIFTSPLHAKHHDVEGVWPVIPPAIDLEAFRPPRHERRNGRPAGSVSIGAWQNHGKGQQLLSEWAAENGGLDIYGIGSLIPAGPGIEWMGALPPEDVAPILWAYKRFVHLPTVIEPFGRCVVEAWAAGCEVQTNSLVGARYFIEEDQAALEHAAETFWEVVGG